MPFSVIVATVRVLGSHVIVLDSTDVESPHPNAPFDRTV